MARHALLIGVSEFADQRLARLNAPINDVTALRGILQDSSRGGFDSVALSLNDDFLTIRDHLSRFFHDRAPDDLLLLYYSGHGILGRGNRLFLATAGSNLDIPRDRSISAQEIRDFIEESRAQRQIVVLDCCHSGAFAEHGKAAAPPPAVTRDTFSGGDAGVYVLTAADALQFAWDGAELRTGDEAGNGVSQFTSWLVEGLEKGEAAPDDERITVDALYRYLFRRARSEGSAATPQRFVQGGVGDLVISANPIAGASQIDPGIMAALAAADFRTRLGGVAELALQIDEGQAIAARAARLLLQRHLSVERDYQVRAAIAKALAVESGHPAETKHPAAEERPAEAIRQTEKDEQRAEAARLPDRDKRRAEAARLANKEKQRAESVRRSEEEKGRAGRTRQASNLLLEILFRDHSGWPQNVLSIIGIAQALLAWHYVPELQEGLWVLALLAFPTFLVIRSERKWVAHVAVGLNLFATEICFFFALDGGDYGPALVLFTVAFAIETVAAVLNIRSRRSQGWKHRATKPEQAPS
jgi:hypothetical protein